MSVPNPRRTTKVVPAEFDQRKELSRLESLVVGWFHNQSAARLVQSWYSAEDFWSDVQRIVRGAKFVPPGEDAAKKFQSYVMTVAHRRLRTVYRNHQKQAAVNQSDFSASSDPVDQAAGRERRPSQVARAKERQDMLHALIARLPPRRREVAERYLLNQEPAATVAADLRVSVDALRKEAERIRDALAEHLGDASDILSTQG